MAFEIIRNDITKVHADAIVNTADPEPIVGAGTDSAIHSAAGPQLLKARRRIGAIAVGESRSTRAYGLPAKYVLHTVSPAWQGGAHGETELLYRAYASSLALAKKLRCRSVAFPLMAAKSLGFPPEIAMKTAIRAFTDFLLENEMQILLVVFGSDAYSLAGSLFDGVRSYVDDRYVSEKKREEYPFDEVFRRMQSNRFEKPARRGDTGSMFVRPARRVEAPAPQAQHGSDGASADFEAPAPQAQHGIEGVSMDFEAPAPQAQHGSEEISADFEEERPTMHAALFRKEARAAENAKQDRFDALFRQAESSFSEYLITLLDECGEKDSAVYRRAEISRQLFHKILNKKDYQPTKSTAIQLALGLRLDVSGTQKLLEKAGYALTRSSKADLVVQYFIEHGEYSVVSINTALFDCGLPLLKTGSAV